MKKEKWKMKHGERKMKNEDRRKKKWKNEQWENSKVIEIGCQRRKNKLKLMMFEKMKIINEWTMTKIFIP